MNDPCFCLQRHRARQGLSSICFATHVCRCQSSKDPLSNSLHTQLCRSVNFSHYTAVWEHAGNSVLAKMLVTVHKADCHWHPKIIQIIRNTSRAEATQSRYRWKKERTRAADESDIRSVDTLICCPANRSPFPFCGFI